MANFHVGIWWYELHGDTVTVEADSMEEAQKKVSDNIKDYTDSNNTFCSFGEMGIDETLNEEAL